MSIFRKTIVGGSVAGLAVAGAMGAAMASEGTGCLTDLKLCAMRAVGTVTLTNIWADTYANFRLTGAEVVSKDNIHARQLAELQELNPKERFYLVSGVTEIEGGKLRQRTFIATSSQYAEIEKAIKRAKAETGSDSVMVTFKTVGQYLKPAYDIFPIVKGMQITPTPKDAEARIESALKRRDVESDYIVKRFEFTQPKPK
jgi:hypothetical protein